MNDEQMLALREEIGEHIAWWRDNLGLGHWEWAVVWCPHPREGVDADPESVTAMDVYADPHRLDFTITVYMPTVAGYLIDRNPDDDTDQRHRLIERLVVHELMHVMVSEMRPYDLTDDRWPEWEPHEERVVSQLTLAATLVADNGVARPRMLARGEREGVDAA